MWSYFEVQIKKDAWWDEKKKKTSVATSSYGGQHLVFTGSNTNLTLKMTLNKATQKQTPSASWYVPFAIQLELWSWESWQFQGWYNGMDIPRKASAELHTHKTPMSKF